MIFAAVAETYAALGRGESPPDTPLPSFHDHASGEAARSTEADVAFWNEAAATRRAPAALYGQTLSGRGAEAVEETVPLDERRLSRLTERAGDPDFATLSPVQARRGILQTALFAWLQRVSRSASISVGVATHGRLTAQSRRMAGCLIDIFPLTLEVAPDETFRSLHNRLRTATFASLRHAVPGANRSTNQGALDAVLNAFELEFGDFEGRPAEVEWLENTHTDPHHPVRLNVIERPGGQVSLRFLFNREIFGEDAALRAVGHYLAVLDAMLEDPGQSVEAVPIALPAEASVALTSPWPRDKADVPDAIAAFREHLARDPEAVAVIEGDRRTTRATLDKRSDAIATALEGLGPQALIGVHLRRSADLIAALIGILKAGHAFVPLDPGQPSARLDAIAQEAQPDIILTEAELRRDWPGDTPQIDVATIPAATTPVEAGIGWAAYVLYTSGTTGRPKGVTVGRPAISRYAAWANRTFAEDRPATWALHSSIGFDLTMTSIFAPLVSGGVIRIYREELGGPDLSILDVFAEDAVDVVKLTPRHLSLALDRGTEVHRIRALVLGGEGLQTALCRRAQRILGPDVALFNEYGPTEATVGCMVHRFDSERDQGAEVPIGRPAEATGIYILDRGLTPVPDRVVGDLYIVGDDRLAEGYLRRDAETRAVFVADPFRPGGLMYKSGDLASVRPDGTILYHGRGDDQLKLGGVRVEPGEIASAVLEMPGVTECAISVHDPQAAPETYCTRCGVGSRTPEVRIGTDGICNLCLEFDRVEPTARTYFREMDDFREVVTAAAGRKTGAYDCIMLLSGGKDSTYALCRLAELTPRILCLTLDNGYISEEAKTNITRVTEALGLDHRFMTTPAMNAIFVDSLKRHANVCNGCFKTVYTLGLRAAREEGVPLIVTGLSRGQLFETRLTSDLFGTEGSSAAEIDRMVLEARRSYHLFPDAASRSLNGDLFQDGDVLSEVEIVDFYRYCDVPVSEIYAHLESRINWTRPTDTGRSSNCLINDVGIFVHKAKRRHHNYALPYSWDVRMGHKSVAEARAELDDEIDEGKVAQILDEIGYDEALDTSADTGGELVCYYTGEEIAPTRFRADLRRRLPREAVPQHFVRLDRIPLTSNGKVDAAALPAPVAQVAPDLAQPSGTSGPADRLLEIFRHYLRAPELTAEDNFYDAGGNSITALQIAARANAEGMGLSAIDVFSAQTSAATAALIAGRRDAPAPKPQRAEIGAGDRARIAALLGKRRRD